MKLIITLCTMRDTAQRNHCSENPSCEYMTKNLTGDGLLIYACTLVGTDITDTQCGFQKALTLI